ncbi:MAG: NAD(P)/FAD-dependent oxidoreductase [Desulfovibrionales bacterium]|nr:NAD(P)/FAD-dependent oxidoreductase [Desulfovibrionales bacterium]
MSKDKMGVTLPGAPMGMTDLDHLEKMIAVARKHNVETVKISGAQRLRFYVDADKAPALAQDLGCALPKPVGVKTGAHSVQACPGTASCKFAMGDALDLAGKLEAALADTVFPGKVKVAVSGCPRNCAESFVRDIGVFAKKKGWTLVFGGNAASRPRIGDIVSENLSSEELLEQVAKIAAEYASQGKKLERCARFIDRLGLEAVQKICQD